MTLPDNRKAIPVNERLIFAMDVASADQARALIRTLGDHVNFYKLGLELFLSGDYFELADELKQLGKRVFADLKLFDIPPTVGRATAQLARRGVDFLTVHGNDGMIAEAVANSDETGILAVTALTSLDENDMADLGFDCDIEALVLSRARRALALGCAGVVSSGLEVAALRQEVDNRLIAVCPGIRPVANQDEQKRTLSAADALSAGADYLVVGRPIRDADDPAAAAAGLQKEISRYFNQI
ncbi:MAG TPA: orotidine-5'-phosphate decarboxylase [Wenzhouxiangella sp.]|nr:orotidine-5'-phosphate decarboxylase [Wenzhouxiangella sp.]